MKGEEVRVRIAPSPTGFFHIGSARTALFNWLFARQNRGSFVLRIEDTDTARGEEKYIEAIEESLRWLGLEWSEGPHYQSKRRDIYATHIKKLLDENKAYYCFCSKEDLEAERQSMLANGHAPKYSGRCRSIPKDQGAKSRSEGKSSVIRFKTPSRKTTFTDLVRGEVTFDLELIGDIVIAKSENEPLFNLANAIDDAEMRISHVIRGEDHLPNTPKQIMLLEALELRKPIYGHIPLILDSGGGKMSKRYAATSIADYQKQGYLPEALINFLALLGWHPEPSKDPATGKLVEREIFSLPELTRIFDISRVQKAGASFNLDKLNWINAQYIRKLSDRELYEQILLSESTPAEFPEKKMLAIIALVKERMQKLSDVLELADFFFALPNYKKESLVWKNTSIAETLESLEKSLEVIKELDSRAFKKESLQELFDTLSTERKKGEVFWPLRVAVSGKEASPGPAEIMEILGKAETTKRIEIAIEKLGNVELIS